MKALSGMDLNYQAEVKTASIPFSRWLSDYCRPEKFASSCELCPYYGKKWSCPPDMPKAAAYFAGMDTVYVIGVKVIYDEYAKLESEKSPEREQEIRNLTYEKAKRSLLFCLLELEKLFPGAKGIMAGGCMLCDPCERGKGRPCRFPDKMRYSYSGFGFDLGQIAKELLDTPLLWRTGGLPDYHLAIASLLTPKGVRLQLDSFAIKK